MSRWIRPKEWQLQGTFLRLVQDLDHPGNWFVVDVRMPGKFIGNGSAPLREAKARALGFAAAHPSRVK